MSALLECQEIIEELEREMSPFHCYSHLEIYSEAVLSFIEMYSKFTVMDSK